MELASLLIDIVKDIPDEPAITETSSGVSWGLILGVIAVTAVLILVLFRKKPKAG